MKPVVAVVGGGAAGLSAAVFLARAARRYGLSLPVTVFEKAPRVGRKLLATGNGTCNITNIAALAGSAAIPANYHGTDPAFAAPALAAFPPPETMAFFDSIGVCCRARADGRVYPLCEQAAAVLDALRLEAAALSVTVATDQAITDIRPHVGGFSLETTNGICEARQVLVTTGGAASSSLGGGSDGYTLLGALGHEKTPLFAAITQIGVHSEWLRAVKGLRTDATLTLTLNDHALASETGELLFTDFGLSGPVAFQLSRYAADWERQKRGTLIAGVNLLSGWNTADVRAEVLRRRALPGRTMEDLLTGLLHKRIGQTVLRAANVLPLGRPTDTLTDKEAAQVAALIQNWTFPVTGAKGLASAQVTAGGVATSGFDPRTMQSRRVPGLFAAGEVLDIDGDCGGYNLQWAWSSAHAAAEAIVKEWR